MGKPKQLYSDEGSSFIAKVFLRFINENGINIFKQTLMHLLLEDLSEPSKIVYIEDWMVWKQDKSDWVKHVDNMIKKI